MIEIIISVNCRRHSRVVVENVTDRAERLADVCSYADGPALDVGDYYISWAEQLKAPRHETVTGFDRNRGIWALLKCVFGVIGRSDPV